MSNEEKKETGFDKKVVYDEKGDYQVLNTNSKEEKAKDTTATETEKAKRTLADKLPKASPTPVNKPLSNPTSDAKTTPLEELDLKTPKTVTGLNSLKPEPAKVDSKEPLKPEPVKAGSKEPLKPEPTKADLKEPLKPEPTKADSKEPLKPEPVKADSKEPLKPQPVKADSKEPLKPEPVEVDSKEPLKSEPVKADPKEPLKPQPVKADSKEPPKPEPVKADPKEPLKQPEGLSKMNLGTTSIKAPTTPTEEAPKAEAPKPETPETPKEEPKKETVSDFELHPLAEICGKLHYDIPEFISTIRRNSALLATNPQDRFYMDSCKALIIHGVRMLDDSGTLLIHIETESAGHAIIKVSSNSYQDCTGVISPGQLITAEVGGKELSLTSMAFLPKLRFIK